MPRRLGGSTFRRVPSLHNQDPRTPPRVAGQESLRASIYVSFAPPPEVLAADGGAMALVRALCAVRLCPGKDITFSKLWFVMEKGDYGDGVCN